VSNSFFFYKTAELRVKDKGIMMKGKGRSVKDKVIDISSLKFIPSVGLGWDLLGWV
jgi:hypothetical protein